MVHSATRREENNYRIEASLYFDEDKLDTAGVDLTDPTLHMEIREAINKIKGMTVKRFSSMCHCMINRKNPPYCRK